MSEESKALVAALKMLGRRDYFYSEMQKRLQKKGFPTDLASSTCRRCEEMGYLNDQKLAQRFSIQRSVDRGWGPTRIRAELLHRGVAEALVEEVANLPDEIRQLALAKGLRRAEQRARAGWWRGREGRFRMVSSLLRRGFEPEEARGAVGQLAIEREASECEP